MVNTVTIDSTEYMGAVTTRFVDVQVTNYDDDGNGDGESFSPGDVSMRRFQSVIANVSDGSPLTAAYDEETESIRLYSGGTEVESDSGTGVRLRLVCMGR